MTGLHNDNQSNGMTASQLYLDLLKKCLLNTIYEDAPTPAYIEDEQLTRSLQYSSDKRLVGRDWPTKAHTMIGLKRLNNIQVLAEDVLNSGIEGDFIEAGVWRGGATIFMRGLLKAYGITNRSVWVADSFCGFPKPEELSDRSYNSPGIQLIKDAIERKDSSWISTLETLRQGTQLEEVKQNFERYGLLDEQVKFISGFFHHTLPSSPIQNLAILRADGDLYDSTYQILENLYPRVTAGGYVIIDDYHSFLECRKAVHDYLDANKTQVELVQIDSDAVYWQKM